MKKGRLPIEITSYHDGDDTHVGTLYVQPGGGADFRYAEQWVAGPDAYAIAPSIPLRIGSQHLARKQDGRLPQAFTDSAPDRWGRDVIHREWRHRHRAPATEAGYLLEVSDRLRVGALRYWTDGELRREDGRVPKLIHLADLESAARRAELHEEVANDIRALFHAGSSLGGARPKATVETDGGRLVMAKFSSPKDRTTVVAWEKVCLDIAHLSGITTPRSTLKQLGTRAVLLLDRFDRRYETGTEQRVPYMSAMTLLDRADGDTASMTEIAEGFESLPTARVEQGLRELWTRAALNLLVGNTDNHLRNHGFLWTSDGWELSPVFDVTPATDKTYFAVGVDEMGDDTLTTLLGVSEYFRLDRRDALGILAQVVDAVDQWRDIARHRGIPLYEDRDVGHGFAGEARDEARRLLSKR